MWGSTFASQRMLGSRILPLSILPAITRQSGRDYTKYKCFILVALPRSTGIRRGGESFQLGPSASVNLRGRVDGPFKKKKDYLMKLRRRMETSLASLALV